TPAANGRTAGRIPARCMNTSGEGVTDAKADLENLIKSPGWLRIRAWAAEEYAAQLLQHTELAANDTNDAAALHKLRQVIAARKAIQTALGWPERELQKYRVPEQTDQFASLRRGGF